MNPSTIQSLRAAIAESIATARCVRVAIPFLGIKDTIRFIRSRYVDVDWDPHFNRITIFGNDPSVPISPDGEGDEGHFVIDLVFPLASQSNPYAE